MAWRVLALVLALEADLRAARAMIAETAAMSSEGRQGNDRGDQHSKRLTRPHDRLTRGDASWDDLGLLLKAQLDAVHWDGCPRVIEDLDDAIRVPHCEWLETPRRT